MAQPSVENVARTHMLLFSIMSVVVVVVVVIIIIIIIMCICTK